MLVFDYASLFMDVMERVVAVHCFLSALSLCCHELVTLTSVFSVEPGGLYFIHFMETSL